MQITVNLPDDVCRAARSLARRKGISLGNALAELALVGLRPFPTFTVSKNSKPIALEQTLEALAH
jgi:hypothetical protein